MATDPAAEPLQYMPQNGDEALALLQGELQSQSAQFTQEAVQRAPVAIAASNTLDTQNDLDGMLLAQASTPTELSRPQSRVITNQTLAEQKRNGVIARYPAGTPMSASGNVRPEVDDAGNITVINEVPVKAKQSDEKVAATVVTTPSLERQYQRFDVTTALEKAKTLGGELLADYTSKTLSDIDVAMAGAMGRIRSVAAMESGYASAKAAYDRELLLDQTSGFANRFGQASGQTQLAQQTMARTLQVSQALERSLAASDSELAQLSGAKLQFTKLETRRANRELKIEDKRDAIAELVTPVQLANFRFLRGSTGDDTTDSLKLFQQQKSDKALQKLVNADTSNIHQLLVDPDLAVQNGAKKLFLQYEKAANPNIPKDAETTDTLKLIDKALKNPNLLIDTIPDSDRRATVKRALTTPKSGKELAIARQEYLPDLLASYVENATQGKFLADVRTWTGTGVQDPASPLQKSIKKLSATAPDGRVPVRSFIDDFVKSQVQDASGTKLSIQQKIAMLTDTVNSSVNNLPKNLLINADAIDGMRLRLLSQMKVDAATAFIRSQNLTPDERLSGQSYLYSKDFRAPPK